MFVLNKNQIQEQFEVKVSFDTSVEDKKIGEFTKDKDCFAWKLDLTDEETEATNNVLKLDRLLKISVTKDGVDEGFSSQDKEEEDFVFDNNNEINEFEKSLEKFEDDFKENQSSLKSLHKKVASISNKSSGKKVSDFFKPKQQKKATETRSKASDNKDVILRDMKDKGNEHEPDKEPSGKRPHPFAESPETKPKKAMLQSKSMKTTPVLVKKRASKKNGKSPATKFSDLISHENPTGRWGHAFCKICDDKAVVIGGQEKQQMNSDSMWLLDLKTRTWELQKSDNSTIDRRVGHSTVYDEKRKVVFVYGGSKQKKWYSDVYALSVETWEWEKSETIGKAPTRAYHSCNKFHDELFVFGGVYPNPDPEPDGCSNQLIIYDIANKSWYTPIISGDIPTPRSGHSAVMIGSKLYIFGGWDAPTCYNDIYCLDIVIMKYTKLKPTGDCPTPRTWHSTSALSNPNQFCIYGGYDGKSSLNDLYVFDAVKTSWTKIQNKDQSSILRAGHTSLLMTSSEGHDDAIDNKKNQVLIFGGGNNEGQFYNDVVLLDL